MGSKFGQRSQVTQPPPICRKGPKPGPVPPDFPPPTLICSASWYPPAHFPDTTPVVFTARPAYDPIFEWYTVELDLGNTQVFLRVNTRPPYPSNATAYISFDQGGGYFQWQNAAYLMVQPNQNIFFRPVTWDTPKPNVDIRLNLIAFVAPPPA